MNSSTLETIRVPECKVHIQSLRSRNPANLQAAAQLGTRFSRAAWLRSCQAKLLLSTLKHKIWMWQCQFSVPSRTCQILGEINYLVLPHCRKLKSLQQTTAWKSKTCSGIPRELEDISQRDAEAAFRRQPFAQRRKITTKYPSTKHHNFPKPL
jgi:hypothetical protein